MTPAVPVGVNATAKDVHVPPTDVPAPTGPTDHGAGEVGEAQTSAVPLLAEVVAERWAPDPWRALLTQAQEREEAAAIVMWLRSVNDKPVRRRSA